MKNNVKLPLVAIPAVLVTAASLVVLLATVAAASKPGDLLYSLRGPAMQVPFLLSNDNAPTDNLIGAPKPSSPVEPAPPIQNSNSPTIGTQISPDRGSPTQTDIKSSDDAGKKELENETQHENETEKENESGGDDSGSHGSDDSSGSNKGKK